MKVLIKDNILQFRRCGKTMLLFELIFKSISVALFYPLFLGAFKLSLLMAGVKYLTNGYIGKFLSTPSTIILFIILVILIGAYIFFEKCCLNILFEAIRVGEKVSIVEMFSGGFISFRNNVFKRNPVMLFYEIFLFPFSNVVLVALTITNLSLPDYVTRAVFNRNGFYLILMALFVVMFFIAISQIFVPNFMLSEQMSVADASRKSMELLKGRAWRTLLTVLVGNLFYGVIVGLIFLLITGLVVSGVFILNLANIGIALYLTIFKSTKTIVSICLILISVPATYLIITDMFYRYRLQENVIVSQTTMNLVNNHIVSTKRTKRMLFIGTLLSTLLIIVYIIRGTVSHPFDRVELLQTPDITAHRGSSKSAPENTMAAFNLAVDEMADYIELDVHLTMDGRVVVLHDANLKRTTGVNKYVYTLWYDAIRKMDAGSFFSEEYSGEYIPTLEEVISELGDEVMLNIEIKYNKREDSLVERVVDIIEKYEYEDRCIIMSTNYDVLTRVKLKNDRIRTGYVLSAAYGTYYNAVDVDVISISHSYVNKMIVDAVHNSGKEIHVWTVNSPSLIRKMANLGVDNIITDDPLTAREVIYSRYTVKEIKSALDYIFKTKGY